MNSFRPQGFSLTMSLNTEFQTGSPAVQWFVERGMQSRQVVPSLSQAGSGATGTEQQQKIAAALTKAGISNPAAWAAAGVPGIGINRRVEAVKNPNGGPVLAAASSMANSGNAGNSFDLRPPVVLMKGTNNKAFIISWRSQKEVAQSLGWKCALMIWGGPPLALLSLYVLLAIWKLL